MSGWQGDPAIDILIGDFNLYDSFSMCLATQSGGNGGVLAIGDDYSKDTRFQWTDIVQDQWYTGNFFSQSFCQTKLIVYMENWWIGGTSLNVPAYDLNWDGVCRYVRLQFIEEGYR